jgi:hypothetical protein
MKRFIVAIISLLSIALAAPVFAAQSSIIGAVSLAKLSSNDPAILPNNPFYAFKVGFERFFSGTKLTASLSALDDKAAEVGKSMRIAPDNESLVLGGLTQYQKAATTLLARINRAKASDIEVGFVDLFAERILVHLQFADDILTSPATPAIRAAATNLNQALVDLAAASLKSFETEKGLREKAAQLAMSGETDYQTLRLAEVLSRIVKNDESLTELRRGADDLYVQFTGLLEAQHSIGQSVVLDGLASLSGDNINRLASFAEIAERLTDSELKSQLNVVRSKVIKNAEEKELFTQDVADAAIKASARVIQIYTATANSTNSISALSAALVRANFNNEQAGVLLSEGAFENAYLQAKLAYAAASSARVQLSDFDLEAELANLRAQYDLVSQLAAANGVLTENIETAQALLSDMKTKIADLTARISAGKDISAAGANIRNLKIRLAFIAGLLVN